MMLSAAYVLHLTEVRMIQLPVSGFICGLLSLRSGQDLRQRVTEVYNALFAILWYFQFSAFVHSVVIHGSSDNDSAPCDVHILPAEPGKLSCP